MSTDTTMVTGVDFVCVPSADFDAALEFYGEVLGLERSALWQRGDEPPVGAEFETGNMTIAVIGTHVEDVAATRAELESRGVSFAGETIDSGVCHMANFSDREGNALMLHHRYAPFTHPAPRRGQ